MSEASDAYELLHVVEDRRCGLQAVVALHSTRLGPAFGGIRRMAYPSLQAARADALELAQAMTIKCALAGLPAGGGKTAVVIPTDGDAPDWPAAYRRLGDVVASLHGQYVCGPDVGTGAAELAEVRTSTEYVNPEGNDAGASTAAGVLAGLRTIWTVLGRDGARGARVAVQGLGSVGNAVAARLRGQGAEVLGADPDPDAMRRAESAGVTVVDPATILATECDVLVPCATGHVLTEASIESLSCRAVCGSANNQLASEAAAAALHRRGIVHAPDEVVSAGAVIEGVLTVLGGAGSETRAAVQATIDRIADTLAAVLEQARVEDRPPAEVARARGRLRVESGG